MNPIRNAIITPDNKDAVWDRLKKEVDENTKFVNDEVKTRILDILAFERKKKANQNIKTEIDVGPFAVPSAAYESLDPKKRGDPILRQQLSHFNQFVGLVQQIARKKKPSKKMVPDVLSKIVLLLNPTRLIIDGAEVTLRDNPIKDPVKTALKVTAKANCKQHGLRRLCISWNHFDHATYRVQLLTYDTSSNEYKVLQEKQVKGSKKEFIIKDDETSTDFFVKLLRLDEPESNAPVQGPFYCPKNESLLSADSLELLPVDKFRLKIDGKYNSVFDLLELLEKSDKEDSEESKEDSDEDLEESEENSDEDSEESEEDSDEDSEESKEKLTNKTPLSQALLILFKKLRDIRKAKEVPWDRLLLPKKWKDLDYTEKVLHILSDALHPVFSDEDAMRSGALLNQLTVKDNFLQTNSVLGYIPSKGNGSVQRKSVIGSKRNYTSSFVYSDMENAFMYAAESRAAKEKVLNLNSIPWRGAKPYCKAVTRTEGLLWKEGFNLNTSKERESCSRLRRVQRMLDASFRQGRPVLEKSVAAPFNYAGEQSSQRYTLFGTNNYDRTQAFPAVMPVPYVMSKDSEGMKVLDPQESYGVQKSTRLSSVINVAVASGKYRHPVYPSKEKLKSWSTMSA